MENLEEKIGAILNNPQLMQQVMSMAQSLGQSQPVKPDGQKEASPPTPTVPSIDAAAIQKLAALTQQSGIDNNQQMLLHALSPYLSQDRISRLERAMRAAKMARYASALLGSGGLQLTTGR